ncbi:MAG: prepilin-type N-terminal cleavage/methylation domain-containing protein [Candidatus Wallbacteria bacterium]|nr:prepilin-type N-terminal cleavage/methylation domain-containing protein [Candidatus Wallbacteria bacterium]
MRRRGFTLVELLVAALLSAFVLAGAWWMFVSGSRQSVKLDLRLARLQGIVGLLEALSDDLAQAVYVPPAGSQGNGVDAEQLTLFKFRAYALPKASAAGEEADASAVWTEPVVYRFERATGQISRNGRPMPLGRFTQVGFHPPDNIVPGVRVVCTAESLASDPSARFEILLPLERAASEAAFESWQENYYDMEPVVELIDPGADRPAPR